MAGAELTEFLKDQTLNKGGLLVSTQGYYTVTLNLVGTAPATAANYNTIGIFPYVAGTLESVTYSYSGEGGSGAAFSIEKCGTGVANGSGTAMTEACDTATAGNVNKPLSATLKTGAAIALAKGDRISIVDAGTLTSLDDLSVTIRVRVTTP